VVPQPGGEQRTLNPRTNSLKRSISAFFSSTSNELIFAHGSRLGFTPAFVQRRDRSFSKRLIDI
jgi:hypothetical protein